MIWMGLLVVQRDRDHQILRLRPDHDSIANPRIRTLYTMPYFLPFLSILTFNTKLILGLIRNAPPTIMVRC